MDEKDVVSRLKDGSESLNWLLENLQTLPFHIQFLFIASVERFTTECRQLHIEALQRMGEK